MFAVKCWCYAHWATSFNTKFIDDDVAVQEFGAAGYGDDPIIPTIWINPEYDYDSPDPVRFHDSALIFYPNMVLPEGISETITLPFEEAVSHLAAERYILNSNVMVFEEELDVFSAGFSSDTLPNVSADLTCEAWGYWGF